MADENQTQEQAQPQATQTQQADPAELTISDLSAMKVIIDVASSRGAFKPAEMVLVGQTYNKLSTFLDTVAKQPKQGS